MAIGQTFNVACSFMSKLPKAGVLRIKNAPKADVQLLKSGCEVCSPPALHLLTAKQTLQTGRHIIEQTVKLFVYRKFWLNAERRDNDNLTILAQFTGVCWRPATGGMPGPLVLHGAVPRAG